jgi:hypothetical protein
MTEPPDSEYKPEPPDSEYKPEPPNLDLIGMVQAARRQFDADAQPSQVGAVYWIEAHRATAGAEPTPRAGQWLIETTAAVVDTLWAQIKAATQTGQLGYKSKVATTPRELGTDRADRRICVVTYDADDLADVERVRAALEALDVPMPLTYERLQNPE